jgi:hypothetical protein
LKVKGYSPFLSQLRAPTVDGEKCNRRKESIMIVRRLSITVAALVVAVSSLSVVGQAAAEVWPDGRAGAQLSTESSIPDFVDRAIANLEPRVLAPDDRGRVSNPAIVSTDLVDRALANLQRRTAPAVQSVSPGDSSESFDWRAAGVGASTSVVLLLVLGLGIGMARRSRTRSAAA